MKLDLLAKLSGNWICRSERSDTEELWQSPKAGMMLGLNRTVKQDGKTAFEFLRIFEQNEDIYYAASPGGRPATTFKLIIADESRLMFENPDHDFPARISYTFHSANNMTAKIEGKLNGKYAAYEWNFDKE